jgi:hypothetical protein
VRELPVQREDRTDLGSAGIAQMDLLRVGDERADLRAYLVGGVAHADRVAERLRHLAAVRAGDQGGVRQQRPWFDEHLAVQAVELADDLARQLDVHDLILADRDELALDDRDVDRLQQWVAEQPEVRDVSFGQIAKPFLVRRNPFEPPEGRDHSEQQEQLGDLRDLGLPVERHLVRIDAGSEQVEDEAVDAAGELVRAVVVRRQHVPVGDEVEAVVRLLQREHVEHVAEPVPDVHRTGGAVSRQDASLAAGP